jgi:hypothetical protein
MDQVGLDHQVLVDELGAQGVVGVDAADPGRRDEDEVGLFPGEKGLRGGLVQQVQFRAGAGEDVAVAGLLQAPDQRGTDHAAVAGDVNAGRLVHRAYSLRAKALKPCCLTSSSRSAALRSSRTISATSSAKVIFGVQPSFSRALVASPSRVSTSVGRK